MDKDKKGFSIGLTDFINFSSLYEFKFIWLKQPTLVELPRDFKLRCVFFFLPLSPNMTGFSKIKAQILLTVFFPLFVGFFLVIPIFIRLQLKTPPKLQNIPFLIRKVTD